MEFNVKSYVSGFCANIVQAVVDSFDDECAVGQLKYPELHDRLEAGDEEIWVPCAFGYEEFYEVSNFGQVRSKNPRGRWKNAVVGRPMRQQTNGAGRKWVNFTVLGKGRNHLIHRLVRYSFYENPNPAYLDTVEHDEDKDPANNQLNNLIFASRKYQNQRCNKKPNPKSNVAKTSRAVDMLDLEDGHVIMTHASMSGAARWLQQHGWPSAIPIHVGRCAHGKTATAYGYRWRLVEVIQDLPGEVWQPVPGNVLARETHGPYKASTEGRIQNKHGKLISGGMQGKYLTFGNVPWNRIIAFTFCHNDDPDTKTMVKHLNNVTTDNRAANLIWDTQKANVEEAHRDGLIDKTNCSTKVKATNTETGEQRFFDSITQAHQAHSSVTRRVMEGRLDNGKTLPDSPWKFERIVK